MMGLLLSLHLKANFATPNHGMNSYQAIVATDLAQLASTQSARLTPAQALACADDTWSETLLWSQNPASTDQAVFIDRFESGASLLSLLRLWHETRPNSRPQNSANLQPQLTVYALDSKPWTRESLKAYWLGSAMAHLSFECATDSAMDSVTQDALSYMIAHWPEPTPGLHFIHLEPWACALWLWFGEQERSLMQLSGSLDAIWPNPDRSTKAQRQLNSLLNPSLQSVRLPKAVTVAVIGAGIAGSCTAKALCDQGFEVHLLDAAEGPATGASGNWVGAFHPHITRDDTPLSQLTRLGCEFSLQALEGLTRQGLMVKGVDWDTPGHLQTIPPDEVERTRGTLAQLQFPSSVVQWAEPFSRMDTPLQGLFFPQGAWVKPTRWVQANLEACGLGLTVHYQCAVECLTQLPHFLGFKPDAVVIACAQNTLKLAGLESTRSNSVKGQITRLKRLSDLPHVASGESYAIAPPTEDWILLGATYERPVGELKPTEASDGLNIQRFKAAFPEVPLGAHLDSRCAVRFVWADRLPVVGLLVPGAEPENANLQGHAVYLNTAYASRGLSWAALAAYKIAMGVRQSAGLCAQGLEWKLTERMNPRI